MSSPIIRTEQLVKHFGEVQALKGVDLEVQKGTVLGMLGPNGAGKTTAVRILTTLLAPTSGRAEVDGLDVVRDAEELRFRIGLAGQSAAVDENLTGLENLELVGRLYHLPKAEARRRGGEVLERFGLSDAADRPAKTYSGGMRRRLDLAASLVGRPDILFLDEPTTGLDPRSRIDVWDFVRELQADGTTLLLTTQYLEEADQLADRIAVIDEGTVIAEGTSDELKDQIGGEVLELHVDDASHLDPRGRGAQRCRGRARPPSTPTPDWFASRWAAMASTPCATACAGSTRARSGWPTSHCTARRWTTCSCRSRAASPRTAPSPSPNRRVEDEARVAERQGGGARMSAVAQTPLDRRAPSSIGGRIAPRVHRRAARRDGGTWSRSPGCRPSSSSSWCSR